MQWVLCYTLSSSSAPRHSPHQPRELWLLRAHPSPSWELPDIEQNCCIGVGLVLKFGPSSWAASILELIDAGVQGLATLPHYGTALMGHPSSTAPAGSAESLICNLHCGSNPPMRRSLTGACPKISCTETSEPHCLFPGNPNQGRVFFWKQSHMETDSFYHNRVCMCACVRACVRRPYQL